MELQRLERAALIERVRTARFEAAMTLMSYSTHYLRVTFGERAGYGYRNPQLNKLVEVASTAADPDVVDQAYRGMSDILRRDLPLAFLLTDFATHIVHRRVKGLNAPWRSDPLKVMEYLWLEDRGY